jgi:hypothetical protein
MSLSIDLNANLHNIPPMLARRMDDAILIVESNSNERRVTEHLRALILSFSNPLVSPMHSIMEYLNSPDTQFSATRELFENLQDQDEEVDEEVDQDNLDVQDARHQNEEVDEEVDQDNLDVQDARHEEVDEEVDQDNLDVQDARHQNLEEQEHENNWDVPEIPPQPAELDNNVREERQRRFNELLDFINRFN